MISIRILETNEFEDRKFYISRTLLRILADFNNAVVWVVSTCHLISKSSSPFTNILSIVPSAPITICINVTSCSIVFWLTGKKAMRGVKLSPMENKANKNQAMHGCKL